MLEEDSDEDVGLDSTDDDDDDYDDDDDDDVDVDGQVLATSPGSTVLSAVDRYSLVDHGK